MMEAFDTFLPKHLIRMSLTESKTSLRENGHGQIISINQNNHLFVGVTFSNFVFKNSMTGGNTRSALLNASA